MKNKFLAIVCLGLATLVGCGGGGGGSSNQSSTPTPLAVGATSYANKNTISLDYPQITSLNGSLMRSVTFGDFFQDGSYSAFVAVNSGATSEIRFLKSLNGTWIDATSSLVPTSASRTICTVPTQAITADFNGDGKPDVYVSCKSSTSSSQYFVLSQSGQLSYVVQALAVSGTNLNLQSWGAAAGDVDGDGDIDLVVTDNDTVIVLENLNSGASWVKRTDLITGQGSDGFPTKPRRVFLPPRAGGRPDLVVGGDGSLNNFNLVWIRNSNSLKSANSSVYNFNGNTLGGDSSVAQRYPVTATDGVTSVSATIYDVVLSATNLLVLAKNVDVESESTASKMYVLRYELPTAGTSLDLILGHELIALPGSPSEYNPTGGFVSQFKLNSNGQLVAYDGACVSGQQRCSFAVSP